MDKIVLGRRYGISEWLPGAYEAVCTRENPLTVEEGMKLGVEDIIKISTARQAYGYAKARFELRHLAQDLGDIFGLEESFEAQKVGSMDVEDEAIKALEGEVSNARVAFLALPAYSSGPSCTTFPGCDYGDGPECYQCGQFCKPVEPEERRLKREDKEEKERRLQDLTDKRQQRQQDRAAKSERISLFRQRNSTMQDDVAL